MRSLKPKTCKICKSKYIPFSSFAKACSPECAIEVVRQEGVKEFNRETRKRKQSIKSRGDWLREAQQEFNRFIRGRDVHLPCVSCCRFHSGQYHAGHYFTVGGHPELRFNEDNCHKQCSACNNHLSGNIAAYRVQILKRIGQERLERLEGPHEPAKLTIDDIKEIKALYNRKFKELQNVTT